MTRSYVIESLRAATTMGWPNTNWRKGEHSDCADGFGVWAFDDGVPVDYIGEDGGEPEDQSLCRDWKWVAEALQRAYDDGVCKGRLTVLAATATALTALGDDVNAITKSGV